MYVRDIVFDISGIYFQLNGAFELAILRYKYNNTYQ